MVQNSDTCSEKRTGVTSFKEINSSHDTKFYISTTLQSEAVSDTPSVSVHIQLKMA
jgi:hypothetical protein